MKRKLLISDSNASELAALIEIFSNLEEIDLLPPAKNCEETLQVLRAEQKPDLLLLDLMLHGGDGFAVLDAVESLPKQERPLVFLMTAISHERLLLALQDRVVFCFIKPFRPERVVLRVLQLACEPERKNRSLNGDDPYMSIISETLLSMGVPAHLRGYHYLREAIRLYLAAENPLKLRITRDVYPVIAKEQGEKESVVENSIRFAIDFAWTHGNLDMQHRMFGYTTKEHCGKPSNAEFIAMVAEHIRLNRSL